MYTDDEYPTVTPLGGQIVFATLFLTAAALLLAAIGEQTQWFAKTRLAAQPRLWPAIGLGGMVLFGALHWLQLPRKAAVPDDWAEGLRWLASFEWVAWFLVYVWCVPIAGYLPVTVVFTTAMTRRLGYRGARWYLISAAFAGAVVVLFKGFLSVKIPGAMVYEYLPGALRNFFILNL